MIVIFLIFSKKEIFSEKFLLLDFVNLNLISVVNNLFLEFGNVIMNCWIV